MRRYIYIVVIIALLGLGRWWWSYQASKQAPAEISSQNQSTELPNRQPETSLPENQPSEEPKESADATPAFVDHDVPFTPQAPTGGWDDERQQDGCEEASALMAMRWVQDQSIGSADALHDILAISDYEQKKYGEYRDVSLADVRDWIFKDYFKYDNVEVKMDVTSRDIINALEGGAVILAPMHGQRLNNPYFSGEGPERHMLVIKGYDPNRNEFITNDPGTKRGADYRYSETTIMNSILAYPTGHHEPVNGEPKGILIVRK